MTKSELKEHYDVIHELPLFKLSKDKNDFNALRYSGTYLSEEYKMLENFRLNELFNAQWN